MRTEDSRCDHNEHTIYNIIFYEVPKKYTAILLLVN